MNSVKNSIASILPIIVAAFVSTACMDSDSSGVVRQPGIIGTLVLAGIVLMAVCVFIVLRLNGLLSVLSARKAQKDLETLK